MYSDFDVLAKKESTGGVGVGVGLLLAVDSDLDISAKTGHG